MIDYSKPVRVFKNWRLGCYNIMQDGRLLASAREIRLGSVEFLVRESGRQRMLRRQKRNVHAYAIGHLVDYVHPSEERSLDPLPGRGVFYDPYRFSSFVDVETRDAVTRASSAHFHESGVTYRQAEAETSDCRIPRAAPAGRGATAP